MSSPSTNRPSGQDSPVNPASDWSPGSWRNYPALQQATYPDDEALNAALAKLEELPPLVTSWEILSLKEQIAEAQAGKRFFLQGGDCADNLSVVFATLFTKPLQVLVLLCLALVDVLEWPVVRIGRFAGLSATPRYTVMDTRGFVTLPC